MWLLLALSLLGGAALGVGAAVATDALRGPRIAGEEEVDRITGLPVLARVPRLPADVVGARRGPAREMTPATAEAFRTLQVQLELEGGLPRSILVTSPSRGDGKTTSVAQLGRILAAAGRKVLLIDFDVREPQLADALSVRPERDLWQALSDGGSWQSALTGVGETDGLRLLVAGGAGVAALQDGLTDWVSYVVSDAAASFDCVIVDTPPLADVSDALQLAGAVEAILLVTRVSRTPTRALEIATELLGRTGRPVTGVVVVGADGHGPGPYGRLYGT